MVFTKEFKSAYEIGDMVVYSCNSMNVSTMRSKVGVIKDVRYDDEKYNCFVYDIVYEVTKDKEEVDDGIVEFNINSKVDDDLLSAYWRGEFLKKMKATSK